MDGRPSLRELFAELSRPGGGDPADVLRAAGYGDVPESLVAEAVVSYAGTAPLEVAEHLAPFAVAHGPVPTVDPAPAPAGGYGGLSLLASAPPPGATDHPVVDHPLDEHPLGDHPFREHVDLDPSGLDDPLDHGVGDHGDGHHGDPAGTDGLHTDTGHAASAGPPHLGGFGTGHDHLAGDHALDPAGPDHDLHPDHDPHDDGAAAFLHETPDDHDPLDEHDALHEHGSLDDHTLHDPADLLDGDDHHGL